MRISLLLLFIFMVNFGFSQKEKKLKIFLKASVSKDSIMLRWAPSNVKAWLLLNKHGYNINRYTVVRNNKLLKKPILTKLNKKPIKPIKYNNWEKYINHNKYVPIAVQSIFNSEFDNNKEQNILMAFKKHKELKQRYGFALFAADNSILVAKLSGLYFADKSIKKDEMYLYRVMANIPKDSIKIDTGFIYTGVADYKPLPKPLNFKAKWLDRKVEFNWNYNLLSNYYNAYIIEKSEDNGKTFKPISENPIVKVDNENNRSNKIYYSDSLAQNQKIYYYRLKGINMFGQNSPYSDTIQGMGNFLLKKEPEITKVDIIKDRELIINWKYPKKLTNITNGFKIYRSNNPKFNFQLVADIKNPISRSYKDTPPYYTVYYKIAAYNTSTEKKSTHPKFVNIIDTIAPQAPKFISGTIDSLGVVNLSWEKNKETDIYGYRIFKANSLKEKFLQITSKPIRKTNFIDTISLKYLTTKIYYKLTAVDQRQNNSKLSDAIEITKPDTIPPNRPNFINIKSIKEGINIKWTNGNKEDEKMHQLYRLNKHYKIDTSYQFKIKDNNEFIEFLDKNIETNKTYFYYINSTDYSNNTSENTDTLKVTVRNLNIPKSVEKIKYDIDDLNTIILKWSTKQKNIKRFLIYRKVNNKAYKLIANVKANVFEFKETLNSEDIYEYRIKIVFNNDVESKFSKALKINL